ncbi:MAG: hypothetical protein ACRC1M_04920 [Methanobacteriaceae archaeon]
MEKNIKFLIVILLIAVVAAGGYFAYVNSAEYKAEEYNKNLKEAYDFELQVHSLNKDTFYLAAAITDPSASISGSTFVSNFQKAKSNCEKIISLVDNQTTHLENAKKSSNTPEEKEYIDLILDRNAKYRANIKNIEKSCEIYMKMGNIMVKAEKDVYMDSAKAASYSSEMNSLINELNFLKNSGADKDNDEYEKSMKYIKKFLNNHPDFKDRLKNLGLSNSYLGDTI